MVARALKSLVLLSQWWIVTPAFADVWEYRSDGTVTAHRMPDYQQRANLHDAWRPLSPHELAKRRAELDRLISGLALAYDVDAGLVHAIIEVESAYDTNAVSRAGAMGLMQLMPATAERFGVRDPLDPAENIEAGVQYLRLLAAEFNDLEVVLAAYNAGEKAVRRYGNRVPPFRETETYIERVLAVLTERSRTESDRIRPSKPREPSGLARPNG